MLARPWDENIKQLVRLHSNLFLNFTWNDMLTLFCLHHPTHWGAYRKSRAQRDLVLYKFIIVLVIIYFMNLV